MLLTLMSLAGMFGQPDAGGGDDDARMRRPRPKTQKEADAEYAQLMARIPPDLLPAEKAMRRVGAAPRKIAGISLQNDAPQQSDEETVLMLWMMH